MYQKVGQGAFKKGLGNILALSDLLENPHRQFNSIHIAGTNGKGSVAHLLAAIYQANGYRVGLYTSPHYRDFRERIKINGQYIPRSFILEFVEKYRPDFEKIQPSFFEITVALAFYYFARAGVDLAIIETGLGGRQDSTNIIRPLLSIITNISFDHQAVLGNTLKLIAGEKAGIIKEGVAVVIGETQAESKSVFLQTAKEKKSPIFFADQRYRAQIKQEDWEGAIYQIEKNKQVYWSNLFLDVGGPYQYKNLQTVLQATEILKDVFPLHLEASRKGLSAVRQTTRFMGRWQILSRQPLILCDSAHNEAGMRLLTEKLKQTPCDQLHIVLGMLADKNIDKMLAGFPMEARYYFARPHISRGLDAGRLRAKAAALGLQGKKYSSIRNALRAAKRRASVKDLIFVGGSTFVAAEVI